MQPQSDSLRGSTATVWQIQASSSAARPPHLQHAVHIGFVSTRLAGTDGVSLETQKWATTLERMGHRCFYFAGIADTPAERSRVIPEAFFDHPHVQQLQQVAFSETVRPSTLTQAIRELTSYLKAHLAAFVRDFNITVLVVENALTIPMHIPLGLALTELIAETGLPTIAHHHDFAWERQRFLHNCVEDYLAMSFPPRLPTIRHVVINSLGAQQLSLRTGCSATLIPNVMDFDQPPAPFDRRTRHLRDTLGLAADERLVLQPTRIVQRKGIEHAIELISRLDCEARLVISHASGDEGDDYCQRLQAYAALLGVQLAFVADHVDDRAGYDAGGQPIYGLNDIYQHADLVTYPSLIEGFGNAFLEAVYYRKPIVVNRYPIFEMDIAPKGFQVIAFQDYITDETVRATEQVLTRPDLAAAMAEHNYAVARAHYSYTVLESQLDGLLGDLPRRVGRQHTVLHVPHMVQA
jgi:glycosyltransferase involved in cell wall biosynthesis